MADEYQMGKDIGILQMKQEEQQQMLEALLQAQRRGDTSEDNGND